MESFKTETKKTEAETAPKKKFIRLLDEDEVEVKRLTTEDVEECTKVMRKCAFDVTDVEVANIIKYGNSFAATVNRMIVGVGLAWPAKLDIENRKILGGEPNSLYLEDPAVLLAYEGRGIRRILVKEREDEAVNMGFRFSIAYLSEDVPREGVETYILEAGNALERMYLSEGYEFFKTERGILAQKKLAAKSEGEEKKKESSENQNELR